MAKKKKAKAKKKEYNPMAYTKASNPGNYTSAYTKQINAARQQMDAARANLMNFKYDPLQDANYQAMAQVYGARGNIAAQDTLGEAAALNGGQQTSFAVSAAQQARNQYNQELAALVPEFEQNAYQRMANNYGLLQDNYDLIKDLDTEAYGRYRDQVADYQWGKGYDTDIYQYKQAQKKSSSGGGGGGRRRSGGGGSYSAGSVSSDDYLRGIYEKTAQGLNKKETQGPKPNVPQTIKAIAKAAVVNTNKKKNKK